MWGEAFAIAACLVLPARVLADGDQILKPVKFTVIDLVSKKPLTEFSYYLSISSPGEIDQRRERVELAPVHVKSVTGTFVVQAPESCRIELDVDSPDAVVGYQHNETPFFCVLSNDTKREFAVHVEVGITVRGVVRDAATQRPIAGATVAPIIDMHQASGPNMKRGVKTDAQGRFLIRGVNPEWGALVKHPDYKSHYIPCKDREAIRRGEHWIDLQTGRKETIRGIIRDDESRPVPCASISGWEQTTTSGQDGRFRLILPSPDYTHGSIEIKKSEYGDHKMEVQLPVGDELSVVLVPRFAVEGTILSSDGRPVPRFTIAVGPKLEPDHWDCVSKEVRDENGRFAVAVKDAGPNRVVVKAAGHAVWEGAVDVARKAAPATIQLQLGVQVSGRVAKPSGSHSRLEATLIANPKAGFDNVVPETAREMSKLKAEITGDGTFRFSHVRPDSYQLWIAGKDFTPIYRLLEVETRDVELGPLPLTRTGRITGTVYRAGGLEKAAWPLADVILRSLDPRHYHSAFEDDRRLLTDEDGHFVFENVPAGISFLQVTYPGAPNNRAPFAWAVQAIEGKTTQLRAFNHGKDDQLEVSITVGDGSRRQFEIGSANRAPAHQLLSFLQQETSFEMEVTPRINQICSCSAVTNPGNRSDGTRVLLKDVSPGAYHVRLLDAKEYIGAVGSLLWDHDILVKPGAGPMRVTLGAASIEGKVEGGEYGSIIAIDHGSKLPPRRVRYSGDGAFAIRFVREGTYSLIAHDDRRGWGRGPKFDVGNEIASAFPIKLVPGGEVRGRVVARTLCSIPDAVVAVDRDGIEISAEQFGQSDLMLYRIPQLWPGEWTVRLMAKGSVMTSTQVKIAGIATVTADLVVDFSMKRIAP